MAIPASRLYYKPATGELTIEKYWDIDTTIQNKNIRMPKQ
jgi:hypothetical protein